MLGVFLVEADGRGDEEGKCWLAGPSPGEFPGGLTPLGMGCSGELGNGRGSQCCWEKAQQLPASHSVSGCPTTALPIGAQPPTIISPEQPRGCGDGPRGQIHQQPFLPSSPEAMVMGCMARWSQTQLSPFCLAKVGLASSLPGPPQLPLLHLGIHPPVQLPCGAAAVQAGVPCQCHLVAAAPGLLASLCHPWPPTGVPTGTAGAPTCPSATLALGSRWWERLW